MRVSSWKFMARSEEVTNRTYGLMLGTPNREQHFNGLTQAAVEIEDRVHMFSLSRRNFWNTCPELRDEDLSTGERPIRDMLERLGALTWKKGQPLRFELEPVSTGVFRLLLPPLGS